MGGNVFKEVGVTRRYDADEYYSLVTEVLDIVSTFSSRYDVIPAYKTKSSFGDMDVLFTQNIPIDATLLDTLFNSNGNVVHNGGVWSLVHKQFQIDLISTPAVEYDAAMNYFSFNDFSNLKGRVYHKMGLKFGHDGLVFPVRSNDHVLGEVLLSRDPVVINRFGDFLDIVPDTLEDIFKAVAASKYFNPDIFLLENRNHTSRVRDRKRPTYTAFLEWCKHLPPRDYYLYDTNKTVYHKKIFKAFPHAKKQFDALWRRKLQVDHAATLFNGELVTTWTNRTGPSLGELTKVVKKLLPAEVVVDMLSEDIQRVVLTEHTKLTELGL